MKGGQGKKTGVRRENYGFKLVVVADMLFGQVKANWVPVFKEDVTSIVP